MIFEFAAILLICLVADWVFRMGRMPGLVGILFVGVLLGPELLGMISPAMLAIGLELRLMALVVILLRAGLKLNRRTLNRVGGRALLLSFVPAFCEGACVMMLGHWLLGLCFHTAAILGAVISAVSPAVVVPLMLDYIERDKGGRSGAPTMVLAASSIEDTIVIVVFGALSGMLVGTETSLTRGLAFIPFSIAIGVIGGCLLGVLLCVLFDRFNPRATKRALILIGAALLLLRFEELIEPKLPFAALPAVMAMGFIMLEIRDRYAHEMAAKLGKIWIFAEILLFVMVGAQVDLRVVFATGFAGILVLTGGLTARAAGVNLCLIASGMKTGERVFMTAAYLPKATVQAAIASTPLLLLSQAGLDTGPGEIILAMAVLSVMVTAPLGAWAITFTGERFLDGGPH